MSTKHENRYCMLYIYLKFDQLNGHDNFPLTSQLSLPSSNNLTLHPGILVS